MTAPAGYFLTAAATEFTAIGLEPDGSIALGGRLRTNHADGSYSESALLVHRSAGGVLDTSFGADGTGVVYFDGIVQNERMSVGPDGSLLLYGTSSNPLPIHTGFARFTAP